jgi:hypothetical protein
MAHILFRLSIVDSLLGRTIIREKRKREPTMARTAKKKASPRRRSMKSKRAYKRSGSARRKPAKRTARKSAVRRKARAA